MEREKLLNKVKYLINLSKSDNLNEAANAKAMADKLIEKFSITEEEITGVFKEETPYDAPDNFIFETQYPVRWKNSLVLTIAKLNYCNIVEEQQFLMDGSSKFVYFGYGDPEDVSKVRRKFNKYIDKISHFVDQNCEGEDDDYIYSYQEGLITTIRNNLVWYGDDEEDGTTAPKPQLSNSPANLVDTKTPKEKKFSEKKPVEKTKNLGEEKDIVNVYAYHNGLIDGNLIRLAKNAMLEEPIENFDEEYWSDKYDEDYWDYLNND